MAISLATSGVTALTETYEPAHIGCATWLEIAAPVREAVCAATSTVATAQVALSCLAAFGGWLVGEGHAVGLREFADRELIERYVQVGMTGRADSTRATARARLRRIADRLEPNESPQPEAIRYRRAKAPYAPWEVRRLFEQAAAQPTQARRATLTAILALGLGAGLHRQDLAWVRGIDVTRIGGGIVAIDVTGGPRSRRLAVLDDYADLLLQCAARAGNQLVIGGETLGRVNVTNPPLQRMTIDRGAPTVVPSRLRASWLVTHLNLRTPYSVLLPAAGLESSRTLDDLLPYATAVAPDAADELLAGRSA